MKKLMFLLMLIISTVSYGQTFKDMGCYFNWEDNNSEPCRVVKDLYWCIKGYNRLNGFHGGYVDRFGEINFIEYSSELVKKGLVSEEYMEFGLFLIEAAKLIVVNTEAKYPNEHASVICDVHNIYQHFGGWVRNISIEEAKEKINKWFSRYQDK